MKKEENKMTQKNNVNLKAEETTATLANKIDFVAVLEVKNANPNGDPLNGNMPRITYDGLGEISDVCIKRKIRNRLMEFNKDSVFVQSNDNRQDDFKSLKDRYDALINPKGTEKSDEEKEKKITKEEIEKMCCEKWIDVRAFGAVFAFKEDKSKKDKSKKDKSKDKSKDSVSIGIRGPVSIHPAFSVDPINITSSQITKSVNSEKDSDEKKDSDTMGMKHRADFGLYILKGSINVQLAGKTGFSKEDAELIKEALKTLFVDDSSSARPDGSMSVEKLYWFKHSCKSGDFSSKQVHESIKIIKKEGIENAESIDDYDIKIDDDYKKICEECTGLNVAKKEDE